MGDKSNNGSPWKVKVHLNVICVTLQDQQFVNTLLLFYELHMWVNAGIKNKCKCVYLYDIDFLSSLYSLKKE